MLPITTLVQLTFYRCVSYFNTRRGEIHARMTCGDMYTEYTVNKFTRAEAKASVDILCLSSLEIIKCSK